MYFNVYVCMCACMHACVYIFMYVCVYDAYNHVHTRWAALVQYYGEGFPRKLKAVIKQVPSSPPYYYVIYIFTYLHVYIYITYVSIYSYLSISKITPELEQELKEPILTFRTEIILTVLTFPPEIVLTVLTFLTETVLFAQES
jgi:hypothetical protein